MGLFKRKETPIADNQVQINPLGSKTVWGLILTALSVIGLLLGIDFTALIQEASTAHSLVEWLSVVGTAIGLVMAYIGRKNAKGGLK